MPRNQPDESTPPRRTGPRLCAKCGEKEPGPGRILCSECRVRIESWRWGSDVAA